MEDNSELNNTWLTDCYNHSVEQQVTVFNVQNISDPICT